MLNDKTWIKYETLLSSEKSEWKEREDILKSLINGLKS